jgi:alginate O-acetyltransferase complex protein AlgI
MLFNSFEFLVFLLITGILYYFKPLKKFQIGILIVSSLIFYGWVKPWLIGLLLFSVLTNSVATLLVSGATSRMLEKIYAWGGVTLNLAMLAFFKYNKLLILTINGNMDNLSPIEKMIYYLPLPVGISFFTFQGISLVIDVYREKTLDQNWISKHPLKFIFHSTFFISFFPHSVAGPIVKARDFYPQIVPKSWKTISFENVLQALITGYFLKMVIADNLKEQTQFMGFPSFVGMPGIDLLLLILGYSMQIFADFAGYSLIAIGLAALFGYELRDNFLFPYISKSFQEFWQRWHISLSTWLKEYLYVSLGGNRKGAIRTYLNLMITMVLGGLWHGAAWSYAIWGAFHGLLLVGERFLGKHISFPKFPGSSWIQIIIVFTGVSFAWLLFRLPEFNQAVLFLSTLGNNFFHSTQFSIMHLSIIVYSIPVILYHLLYLNQGNVKIQKVKPYLLGFLFFLILTNSGTPGSFIYFRF